METKYQGKSWMIYMLELFMDENYVQENQIRSVRLELDLFYQFDDRIDFKAVFDGHNQYSFGTVLLRIGHSYQREIILNAGKHKVKYRLHDINMKESEFYELSANKMNGSVSDQKKRDLIKVISDMSFKSYKQFTGIE